VSNLSIPAMSEHDARRLTERIRIAAVNYSEAKDKLMTLVQEAKDGAAHLTLGYASWTAYLAEVLGEEPMRLARGERQEMVQMLSNEGVSREAIASITGVAEKTIQRDMQEGTFVPPLKVTGLDGKTYTRPEQPEQEKEVVLTTMEQRPKMSGPRKKDVNILTNVNLGLNGFVGALDQMLRTGLDDSVTEEAAASLYADLNRSIKSLTTIAHMLTTRKES